MLETGGEESESTKSTLAKGVSQSHIILTIIPGRTENGEEGKSFK